jgi:carbonic anhydrase
VFDAAFGELFIIRVAGNVLGPSIFGTLQYAGTHLHTPLFVVLGHEGCGAVEAAIAEKFHGARHRSRIAVLLENIVPALENLDRTLSPAALLSAAVEANVRRTVRTVLESPEGKERLALGDVKLMGAVYDLVTGRVRFLE